LGIGFDCWVIVFSFLDRGLQQWASLRVACRSWFIMSKNAQWVALLRPKCRGTPQLLAALGLVELRILDLTSCQGLNDFWVQSLSSLTALRTLALSGPSTPTTCLSFLCKLRTLTLYFFTEKNLLASSGLSGLQTLSLVSGSKVMSLQVLTSLSALKKLEVLGCQRITDEGLRALSSLSTIRTLAFSACSLITNQSMRTFSLFPQLQSLQVLDCPLICDEGLRYMTSLTQLREFVSRGSWGITDHGVRALLCLPQFQNLVIKRCPSIGNKVYFK